MMSHKNVHSFLTNVYFTWTKMILRLIILRLKLFIHLLWTIYYYEFVTHTHMIIFLFKLRSTYLMQLSLNILLNNTLLSRLVTYWSTHPRQFLPKMLCVKPEIFFLHLNNSAPLCLIMSSPICLRQILVFDVIIKVKLFKIFSFFNFWRIKILFKYHIF